MVDLWDIVFGGEHRDAMFLRHEVTEREGLREGDKLTVEPLGTLVVGEYHACRDVLHHGRGYYRIYGSERLLATSLGR